MRDLHKTHTKPTAECISCGCEIYDGDSTYRTSLGYFCPECIRESFTVCRTEEDHTTAYFTKSDTEFCSMKAAKIRLTRKEDRN